MISTHCKYTFSEMVEETWSDLVVATTTLKYFNVVKTSGFNGQCVLYVFQTSVWLDEKDNYTFWSNIKYNLIKNTLKYLQFNI